MAYGTSDSYVSPMANAQLIQFFYCTDVEWAHIAEARTTMIMPTNGCPFTECDLDVTFLPHSIRTVLVVACKDRHVLA